MHITGKNISQINDSDPFNEPVELVEMCEELISEGLDVVISTKYSWEEIYEMTGIVQAIIRTKIIIDGKKRAIDVKKTLDADGEVALWSTAT